MHGREEIGELGTMEYCMYFKNGGNKLSPWHDIPYRVGSHYNMVVEIPMGTQRKMEINKETEFNPIKQDIKNGKVREVAMKYPFNYGAIPQTWEDPDVIDKDLDHGGDNDPLDICLISPTTYNMGSVVRVKVVGCYAMIDDGETDWKIVCLTADDPRCGEINSTEDMEKVMGKELFECFTFLRDYKIPDGKGPNQFGFDNKFLGPEKAAEVISETHQQWGKKYKATVDESSASEVYEGITMEEVD